MILNKGQKTALNRLLEFEDSENEFNITLIGYAGTGKSTVIGKYLEKSKFKYNCVVSAPTHTAKEIISTFTNKPGTTIQKLCGLRPYLDIENFNVNKIEFELNAIPDINKYKLVIIDECSMINSGLYELIINQAKQFKTKIIFIGDSYQLPPIKETISKTFECNNKIILTEVVRQESGNPLSDLIKLSIESIEKNSIEDFLNYLNYNSNLEFNKLIDKETVKIGYEVFVNKKNFFDYCLKYLIDNENNRYCAWYNDNVTQFNNYIRNELIIDNNKLSNKDYIFSYTNLFDEESFTNILKNSVRYKIENIKIEKCNRFNVNYYLVNISVVNNNKFEYSTIKILHEDSIDLYLNQFNQKLKKAKDSRLGKDWKLFFALKNEFLLFQDIKNVNEIRYSEKPSVIKKQLDYSYATTIHKLQGNTFNNIFINLDSILINKNINEVTKLIYVALSRAKYFAYIYYSKLKT